MQGITKQGLEDHLMDDKKHHFFNPTGDIIVSDENVGGFIPFHNRDYIFSHDRTVEIADGSVSIRLTPASGALLTELMNKGQVPLNEALEIIGKAVNNSYRYDISGAIKRVRNSALGRRAYYAGKGYSEDRCRIPMTEAREFVRGVRGYRPQGDETLVGYCTHAGNHIRALLSQFVVDPKLRYINVFDRTLRAATHDTTLVFDIESQHWAVINSKSPLKPFNLVPFERLKEFGYPYT
ncbi:hypothetical protein CMO83_04015 [Candidatus Woesearchaeota archaeon]|jgi:hypothetical protein|nr:hypothetical protein [Candidatus Woesearchaeota archaeon]|tara:strand:- start:15990 stop:16700 length:711 start_codon:yes stop_codon:yes gene_type:complete